MEKASSFPPIADYGFIGDCHSSALISRSGSIDWCCMPDMASPSCFGRLLDWKKGGYCQIAPTEPYTSSRHYYKKTMVLETHFKTEQAHIMIMDFFSMRVGGRKKPYQQIIRIIKAVKGAMKLAFQVVPRFDYGTTTPWIRRYGENAYSVLGGNNGLLISSNIQLSIKKHTLHQQLELSGELPVYLSILYCKSQELDENLVRVPTIHQLEERLDFTIQWWQRWIRQGDFTKVYLPPLIERSVLTLKCLSHAISGAILAAPTMSLPEELGGRKNWDYRYSWVRDSFFTIIALGQIGFVKEMDRFKRFVRWCTAGQAKELQILYGLDGHRRLSEFYLEGFSGYKNSNPVRVGNESSEQLQFDVYGELLALAWHTHREHSSIDPYYWEFLKDVVNVAIKNYHKADCGIWEFRVTTRHFVFSKVMCWVAVDLGIKLGEKHNLMAPFSKWRLARHEIRTMIEEQGYDKSRGVFIQAFDTQVMDASLLLLPLFNFLDAGDERMIRTTNAIIEDLLEDQLLRRYPEGSDGMKGGEGIFLPCTFWLVMVLVRQNRMQEAFSFFNAAIDKANDLGLFSEEYDTKNKELIGNFPQALTHLSLISASILLQDKDKHLF